MQFQKIQNKIDAQNFCQNIKKIRTSEGEPVAQRNEGGDLVINLTSGANSVYSIYIYPDHWDCSIQGEGMSAPAETIPNEVETGYTKGAKWSTARSCRFGTYSLSWCLPSGVGSMKHY